jgi:hypothetical protein
VAAATTAGVAAVAGIVAGVSLGGSPAVQAGSPASLSVTASGPRHGQAGRDGGLKKEAARTASSGHGRVRPGRSAPNPKPSAKPDAAASHQPATRGTSASSGPSKPYTFYDSTTPQAVPAGAEVAVYATGAVPTPTSAVAGRSNVLWIDTLGTDPGAQIIDVEPGCASPSQVPGWVSSRLDKYKGQVAIVYTTLSEWSEVQADVASLPSWMRSRIRWWIADPTGVPHIVPGSQATQWDWGSSYDISEAEPDFDRV